MSSLIRSCWKISYPWSPVYNPHSSVGNFENNLEIAFHKDYLSWHIPGLLWHIVLPIFLPSLSGRKAWDHMIEFWPKEWGRKLHIPVSGLAARSCHMILYSLSLFFTQEVVMDLVENSNIPESKDHHLEESWVPKWLSVEQWTEELPPPPRTHTVHWQDKN